MEELDDFELTYNNDIEKEIEDFEPSHEIDLVELTEDFKLTNKIDSDQLNNDFIPTLEKFDFETSGEVQPNPYIASIIESIEHNPLLSHDEKINALREKLKEVRRNSNLSQTERKQFERGIERAISNIEAVTGRAFTSGNNTREQSTTNTENNQNNSKKDVPNQEDGIPNSTEENHIHSRNKEEKKLETNEQEAYENLLDDGIQNIFKKYHHKMSKYPNSGRNLTKNFINWARKTEKDPEIIIKIQDIQNNKEISNFIKDKIQNTTFSQSKIIELIEETGLHVSHGPIKNIALEHVFNNDHEEYKERFHGDKYKGVSSKKRELIIQKLRLEVKKENPDSLYKISKITDVSTTTISKIAKECINPELFERAWPPAFTEISSEIKEEILKTLEKEIQNEIPRSLKKISKEFNVSNRFLQDIAKEHYPEQYKLKWPATKRVPLKIKKQIIKTIREEAQKEKPRTLKAIHEDFPTVGSDSIKQLAKKAVPQEIHDKVWAPICRKIPEKIKFQIEECIKAEIYRDRPRSFDKIAKKFNVSRENVRKTASKIIPQSIYRKIWEPSLKKLNYDKKQVIIDYIQNSSLNLHEIAKKCKVHRKTVSNISQHSVFKGDINAHATRFPKDLDCDIGTYTHKNINSIVTRVVSNISNSRYFSEPKIFPDLRSSDGIIPEYNNFLEQRLKNPVNGKFLVKSLGISSNDIINIKATQFDFTNDISETNVINKIEKYQSPGTLFFIVGTKWDNYSDVKELPKNDIIKYPENIKVISHELFADLIGISGKEREIFNNIIDLNNKKDLDALKTLYIYDLSSVDTYNANDLKEELVQKKLIKKDFNEYFKFENLKTEEKNNKQLELDSFINI